MATTLNVELICTDGDLAGRAGATRLDRALSSLAQRTAARQMALEEIVAALKGRSPPILESDLVDVTELRDVVRCRALQIIFEQAMSSTDSLHGELAAVFGREYQSTSKRSYTVTGGGRGPSGGTFRFERR